MITGNVLAVRYVLTGGLGCAGEGTACVGLVVIVVVTGRPVRRVSRGGIVGSGGGLCWSGIEALARIVIVAVHRWGRGWMRWARQRR